MEQLVDFYTEKQENTNVETCEEFLEQFLKLVPEAKEDLELPIEEIDFGKLVNLLTPEELEGLLSWKEGATEPGKKAVKSAIMKYTPDKGDIFGVSNQFKGTILLKNVESKWCSHAYSFAEDKKELLKEPIDELIDHKGEMEYRDFKELLELNLEFDLYQETKSTESEEVLEEVKALELLKHLVAKTVLKDPSLTTAPNEENKINGFIQEKYDEYIGEELTKMEAFMFVKSPSDKYNDSVEIVEVDTEQNMQLTDPTLECVNLFDFINLTKNKKMDVVLSINSCSLKKDGRTMIVMPKMQINQIILYEKTEKTEQTVGLKLNRYNH